MIVLVDVEIVAGECSTQSEAPAVATFDEADLLDPVGFAPRAFLGCRPSLDGGCLAVELGHRDIEGHGPNSRATYRSRS